MNKVLDGGGGEARLQTVRAQGPRRGERTLREYCREGEGLTCVVGARVDDKIQEGARTICAPFSLRHLTPPRTRKATPLTPLLPPTPHGA